MKDGLLTLYSSPDFYLSTCPLHMISFPVSPLAGECGGRARVLGRDSRDQVRHKCRRRHREATGSSSIEICFSRLPVNPIWKQMCPSEHFGSHRAHGGRQDFDPHAGVICCNGTMGFRVQHYSNTIRLHYLFLASCPFILSESI
jgi:hypothetical protein